MSTWHLECSACAHQEPGSARATVCPVCGQPYLVRFDSAPPPRTAVTQRWDMWRYAKVMPLGEGEQPVSSLVRRVRISQPLMSWHLRRLTRAGIVRTERVGREVRCSFDRERFAALQEQTYRVLVNR